MDNLGYFGAQELARQIREFWKERGILVSTWLEPVIDPKNDRDGHNEKIWQVRSDLLERLDEYSRLHAVIQRDRNITVH